MDIAIIEKNNVYRESLKTVLNQINDFKVVLNCSECPEFYQILNLINFNVLLLDYNIGKDKCLESIRKIKQINPEIKIIVLTDFLQTCYYKQFINSGADAVIYKNSSKMSMETQIRNIANKKEY